MERLEIRTSKNGRFIYPVGGKFLHVLNPRDTSTAETMIALEEALGIEIAWNHNPWCCKHEFSINGFNVGFPPDGTEPADFLREVCSQGFCPSGCPMPRTGSYPRLNCY